MESAHHSANHHRLDVNQAQRNLSAALLLLEALQRLGLRQVVLCPGSRSGPLAVAAGLMEAVGLQLVTAVDERSAAFFALGWGRSAGVPAAVITTSGTAVANLLPAAVEADYGAIPLLLLTADRPSRLKGCGANQTVNQEAFLTASLRWFAQIALPDLASPTPLDLDYLASQAMAACLGYQGQAPGPVQLNLALEEPLHVDAEALHAVSKQITAAPEPLPEWAAAISGPIFFPCELGLGGLDPDSPGVVVAGPWRGWGGDWDRYVIALRRWLDRSGWPLLSDGLSGLRGVPGLQQVGSYDLLLENPPQALAAQQVLRLGPLPASRRLQRWLKQCGGKQLLVTEGDPRPMDPLGVCSHQTPIGLDTWITSLPSQLWQQSTAAASVDYASCWHQWEQQIQSQLDLQLTDFLTEPALARQLSRLLPEGVPVMIANSSPVRDWESFADPSGPHRPVVAFRGASGIDGTLSLACGLAEALGQAVLITGDLALLHDTNGWLWRCQLRGKLTVVLVNNNGGGIFEQLPIRIDGQPSMDFERLFAMPQRVDVLALAAAYGVPSRRLGQWESLATDLLWALEQPMALLEVCTDRHSDAAKRQDLRRMAHSLTASA